MFLHLEASLSRLALLVAAPMPGEAAMHDDLVAMYDALRARGFRPEEILAVDGPVRRDLLMALLRDAGARVAGWSRGDVFLYYSGHGAFWPSDAVDATDARPALLLDGATEATPDRWLFWDEAFAALDIPPSVRLTLVPEC
jgi:hypothetical protein